MNTEEITEEIVAIRNRLDDMDDRLEAGSHFDIDDERKQLEERLRYLRDLLSVHGTEGADPDEPAHPEEVHYLPPA